MNKYVQITDAMRDNYLAKMKACMSGDAEVDHGAAELVLEEFIKEIGFPELVDAWYKVDENCGGFWYA